MCTKKPTKQKKNNLYIYSSFFFFFLRESKADLQLFPWAHLCLDLGRPQPFLCQSVSLCGRWETPREMNISRLLTI